MLFKLIIIIHRIVSIINRVLHLFFLYILLFFILFVGLKPKPNIAHFQAHFWPKFRPNDGPLFSLFSSLITQANEAQLLFAIFTWPVCSYADCPFTLAFLPPREPTYGCKVHTFPPSAHCPRALTRLQACFPMQELDNAPLSLLFQTFVCTTVSAHPSLDLHAQRHPTFCSRVAVSRLCQGPR